MTHDVDVLNLFVQRGMAAQEAVKGVTVRHSDTDSEADHNFKQRVNPTPLLCRQHVREFLLDAATRHRPFNKFNRVSEDTLVAANAMLRQWLTDRVKRAPSKGRTL